VTVTIRRHGNGRPRFRQTGGQSTASARRRHTPRLRGARQVGRAATSRSIVALPHNGDRAGMIEPAALVRPKHRRHPTAWQVPDESSETGGLAPHWTKPTRTIC